MSIYTGMGAGCYMQPINTVWLQENGWDSIATFCFVILLLDKYHYDFVETLS